MAAVFRASLFLTFTLLCLPWLRKAGAIPTVPSSSLYDSAMTRAYRLSLMAFEIYQSFEEARTPTEERDFCRYKTRTSICFSESIPTPAHREETLQKSNLELLRNSQQLIQLWLKPVTLLSGAFDYSPIHSFLDRFIVEYMKDLEEIIQTLIRRLEAGNPQTGEISRQTYSNVDINLHHNNTLLKNYGLLFCFRRDMNKLSTFLRIVNCRSVEGSCGL
uniref:Growth hormone n=1 Tax=Cebus imitator TaxID=2715852 RepID=A0A2K5QDB7_CEBIM